ncbi:hypothetical protein ACTD5D_40575 [Nocardia takedensis]|uniref:hypothetical protein n=1 Tax=Nocardia takedensis TaxID=259390 RepID=UPI003F77410C
MAATNRFRLGDTTTAIPLTQQIITGLGEIASQRGLDRLPELVTAAAPHTNDSTVADLIDDLTHLAPTPTPRT